MYDVILMLLFSHCVWHYVGIVTKRENCQDNHSLDKVIHRHFVHRHLVIRRLFLACLFSFVDLLSVCYFLLCSFDCFAVKTLSVSFVYSKFFDLATV